jgi:hypothetical protein
MKIKFFTLLALCVGLNSINLNAATTRYVKTTASGLADGSHGRMHHQAFKQ